MVHCSVLGCKSDSERKIHGLSFHTFPGNDSLRRNWIKATGRINWVAKKSSRICSRHFEQNVLVRKEKLTFLLPNAVPLLSKQPSASSIKDSVLRHNVAAVTEPNTTTPNYTPRTMQRKLMQIQQKSAERLKKLKALREKSRRLTKKVACLENVVAELKAKPYITEEGGKLLKSIDPVNQDFRKKKFYPSEAEIKIEESEAFQEDDHTIEVAEAELTTTAVEDEFYNDPRVEEMRNKILSLQNENRTLKDNNTLMQKDINSLQDKNFRLQENVTRFENENVAFRKSVQQRALLIKQKNSEIHTLQKIVDELKELLEANETE